MRKLFLSSIRRDAERLGIDTTTFFANSDKYTLEELHSVQRRLANVVFSLDASIASLAFLEQNATQRMSAPVNRLSGNPSLPKWGNDLFPPHRKFGDRL